MDPFQLSAQSHALARAVFELPKRDASALGKLLANASSEQLTQGRCNGLPIAHLLCQSQRESALGLLPPEALAQRSLRGQSAMEFCVERKLIHAQRALAELSHPSALAPPLGARSELLDKIAKQLALWPQSSERAALLASEALELPDIQREEPLRQLALGFSKQALIQARLDGLPLAHALCARGASSLLGYLPREARFELSRRGQNALCFCAERGLLASAQALLNQPNGWERSALNDALFLAIQLRSSVETVFSTESSQRDENQWEDWSAWNGNQPSGPRKPTPFDQQQAAFTNSEALIALLAESGADPSSRQGGVSALAALALALYTERGEPRRDPAGSKALMLSVARGIERELDLSGLEQAAGAIEAPACQALRSFMARESELFQRLESRQIGRHASPGSASKPSPRL